MLLVLVASAIVVGIVAVVIGRWLQRKGAEMERGGKDDVDDGAGPL